MPTQEQVDGVINGSKREHFEALAAASVDEEDPAAFISLANDSDDGRALHRPEYAPYYVNASCEFSAGHPRRVNLDTEVQAIKRAFVEARKDQRPKITMAATNPLPGITFP